MKSGIRDVEREAKRILGYPAYPLPRIAKVVQSLYVKGK
jgi:hypothetical protein